MTPQAAKPLIICFDHPHRVGSICIQPCEQCRESPDDLGGFHLTEYTAVPVQPMQILGEAPYAEYLAQLKESGTTLPPAPRGSGYFYYVSVD